MASRIQPSSIMTSSAITEIEQILVCLLAVEQTVTCRPMILSITSAFSPIIVLSITAEFSIVTFLPIRVKLSMQELMIVAPSSIWQCLPMSTAPLM